MDELRHFVRSNARVTVTYSLPPSEATQQGVLKDISGSGLCLFLKQPVETGVQLHVSLQLPGHERPVNFVGEVAWCERYEMLNKSGSQQSIEAGVRYLEIDPKDQAAIMRFVLMKLHPSSPTS